MNEFYKIVEETTTSLIDGVSTTITNNRYVLDYYKIFIALIVLVIVYSTFTLIIRVFTK